MKTGYVVAAVLGGVVIVTAIVVPCVLLLPASEEVTNPSDLPVFEFNDIWSATYNSKSVYPNWDKSTAGQMDFITKDTDDSLQRRSIDKPYDNIEEVAPKDVYQKYKCNGYSVSADALYVFYRYNYTKVWRHSYTAAYVIYDVTADTEVNIPGFSDANIQYIKWSPTGHFLAFVQNFNVYMIKDFSNPEIISVSPTDGEQNMKYYGIPDWMYEEEMIGSNNVIYWSPNSERLAFLETDETGVELIEYTWFGDEQYPETIKIAYPKAGTTIGTVKLWVFDTESADYNSNVELASPFEDPTDQYFSRFTWKNDTVCLVSWTDRIQTISRANLCIKDATSTTADFTCTTGAKNEENNEGVSWVGSFGPYYPVWKTGTEKNDYFTIYPRMNGDNGYWQISFVQEDATQERNWLTDTTFDIVGLLYYDDANDWLYFTGATPNSRNRHIHRVKSTDSDETSPECVTCELDKENPDRCGWINPVFNLDGSGVVINCRGPMYPLTLWIAIDNEGNWNAKPTVIEENEDLQTNVALKRWPQREYSTFDSPSYVQHYNYEIWKPMDFDPNKKYPLLIEVYAGPEFQKVTATWRKGFAQTYMVSNRDVIVASVDGRGSAFQGMKFMREAYKKLGQNEPIDQTEFAKYLIETYDYIDGNHVGLWGWSYGGYTTSHALGYDGGKTFQCGVAVAPLADWRWYDAMYAERYMTLPENNSNGYKLASIIEGHDLTNFKNVQYSLIHGTADDNVHFQSAAEMEKALVAADVDFDDFFYADQDHSINVGNANKHVYRQIDHRLSYCLGRVNAPYP